MRRTALGVGAAASLGAAGSVPAAAQSNTDLLKTAATTIIGGPAAAGAIAYGMVFGGPDDSEVSTSLEWQSHVSEFTRAREDRLALENSLASLGRDVQLVANKAREEAIFRVYEQGVDSGTESSATSAAEAAINDAYAIVEKAIYNSYNIRANRTESVANNLGTNIISGESDNSDYPVNDSLTSVDPTAFSQRTITALNGDDVSYLAVSGSNFNVDGNAVRGVALDPNPSDYDSVLDFVENPTYNGDPPPSVGSRAFAHAVAIDEPDPADYETVDEPLNVSYTSPRVIDAKPWRDLLVDLYDRHSTVIGEVSSIVSTYFTPAQNGEIDLSNALGPAYLTDTAENASDFQEAAMALRAMGFSLAEQTSVVSFTRDGTTYELDGRLARTVQEPNDLPVGTELEPSTITGSIYGAFNIQNDSGERTGEIFEITNPFTIQTAEGNGSVSFTNRKLVESDSTLTNEEINQIFKENYTANQDATETVYETATTTTSGGGGGFLSGSDQNWGVIAIGAGAVALGWGYLTEDDS